MNNNAGAAAVLSTMAAGALAADIADPLMAEIAKRMQKASFNTVAPR